jgi:hypothetical protein
MINIKRKIGKKRHKETQGKRLTDTVQEDSVQNLVLL